MLKIMRFTRTTISLVILSVGLTGCHWIFSYEPGDHAAPDQGLPDLVRPPDNRPLPDGTVTRTYHFPASLKKEVDLLFVVDNSTSMKEEQNMLTAAFPQFVDMLATLSGGMPDIQIGVVSSDLGAGTYSLASCETTGGDKGKLKSGMTGCTGPTGSFITYENGVTNVPGGGSALDRVKSGFTCIAALGDTGCGFESTLESSRLALSPGVNPGFVRKDAMLVIVYITDEDDCSAKKAQLYDPTQQLITDPLGPLTSFRCFEFGVQCDCPGTSCDRTTPGPRLNCKPALDWLYTISAYTSFFKGLKPPGQVLVAALAGPAVPVSVKIDNGNPVVDFSCQQSLGVRAAPAIRIKALVDSFGTASFFSTICSTNYAPALLKLGALISTQLGGACLQSVVDVDATQAGMQASCTVDDLVGKVTTTVHPCKSQSGACDPCPCWRVIKDSKCSALSGYSLRVARSAPIGPGTIVQAKCLGTR